MKTVREACRLQRNALSVKLGDQVEQLDELIADQGNGVAFFERTFVTQGMRALVTEGIARLAGASSQAVFHLKQAMGGGKTHLLVGFGLLAKHPELRKRYAGDVLHIDEFEAARIAAFNGRNSPAHFFWGEIAEQLGKPALFRRFWQAGPEAPDERAWLELFEGNEPVLILLDELPPYFHYLETQKVGNGTVADMATRAFANLLTAAGKKSNVCVVVSDLAAAYESGSKLIHRALLDARAELGRQERNITPVDLATSEVFDILRKRLFERLPDQHEIDQIAHAYGKKLAEAAKAKTASRGAEVIADEIVSTYPFHPSLKSLVALFKENEQFRQTRGLLELISRLLKSVWQRQDDDVFLIGAQHFDFSIPEVRDKLSEISGMREVIAKDVWDAQGTAHAQLIDLESGGDAAAQVSALLLTASLSTAVSAVRGLTREEAVECLVAPQRQPSEFLAALENLQKVAWFLHRSSEGRYYFDRQENLTKLLQSLATDAPTELVDELVRHRLREMFEPKRKTVYDSVLPLPRLEDVADRMRHGRVLVIVSPDSNLSLAEIQRFFREVGNKNNLLVLTGDRTAMASVQRAARHVYAAHKADLRIPVGHAQREQLDARQASYEQDFHATVLGVFDKLLFPIQRPGGEPRLASKPLDMRRDTRRGFDGEAQIERTLSSHPIKLFLDVDKDFDAIRLKAEELLWPQGQAETRWADVSSRYAERAGMPWLPPKGLARLKQLACDRGLWEELGNGYVTKQPQKKRTSAQVVVEQGPDEAGQVILEVNAINAGPKPRIHYAEETVVTESSSVLKDKRLATKALRVSFLVCDPSGRWETGDPVVWTNRLVLRSRLIERRGSRRVELLVAPRGKIRYTLDGSEPRDGVPYDGPVEIGDGEVLLRAFAAEGGLEVKEDFRFRAKGARDVRIEGTRPARLVSLTGHRLDSRAATFQALQQAEDLGVSFEQVTISVGQGTQVASIALGAVRVEASYLAGLLEKVLERFSTEEPVTMRFAKAYFGSGHDLERFCRDLGIEFSHGEVEQ